MTYPSNSNYSIDGVRLKSKDTNDSQRFTLNFSESNNNLIAEFELDRNVVEIPIQEDPIEGEISPTWEIYITGSYATQYPIIFEFLE